MRGKEEMISMEYELENILRRGIKLFMNGQPASPVEIAHQFVKEEAVYMRDYVINDDGVLTQIRFDKVTE